MVQGDLCNIPQIDRRTPAGFNDRSGDITLVQQQAAPANHIRHIPPTQHTSPGVGIVRLNRIHDGLKFEAVTLQSTRLQLQRELLLQSSEIGDFGDARRTDIIEESGQFRVEDLIADEDVAPVARLAKICAPGAMVTVVSPPASRQAGGATGPWPALIRRASWTKSRATSLASPSCARVRTCGVNPS